MIGSMKKIIIEKEKKGAGRFEGLKKEVPFEDQPL